MGLPDYVRLLANGQFRIHPMRWAMAGLVGGCTCINSVMSIGQRLLFDRKIQETNLRPPVFVIGHWRSGTTMLHELLSLDQQFCYPNTFQCFLPNHFLVTRPVLEPLVRLLLPSKRPMDNMATGPRLPQEDEFALVGMGAPTPYYHVAFMNEPTIGLELFNLSNASEQQRLELQRSLEYFYKAVTYQNHGKQLILKSPPHTGRIRYLAKWFPGAKFVHITRHPYKIFPSTVHLWQSLCEVQGYQLARNATERISEYVMDCYQQMYAGYFDQVADIDPGNLSEVRFEDLVTDPTTQMERVYSELSLDGFEQVRPSIDQYQSRRKGYRPNQTSLDEETKSIIDERWGQYLDRFGYREEAYAK